MDSVPLQQIDRTAWAELVWTSATGTWFQSPEAYDFFASLPQLFEPFVVGLGRLSVLRAICVGYVTKDSNALKQFFTRRAIIIGGPCLADDCTHEEVEALMNAVKNHLASTHPLIHSSTHPIYLETRNFNNYSPWREAFEAAGFTYRPHLNFHVTTEGFESRLSDNRKRQIRKAKELVTSELATSESDVREWYDVLAQLYRTKVKTPLFPLEFFLEAYRRKIGHFLLIKHAGHVIGGVFCVKLDKSQIINHKSQIATPSGVVYEWFECGLNAEYKDQYPSVMATYSGIRFAQQQGCSRYDMMGAGEPQISYGVRDFKAEFGGTLVEHGRFLCVCRPVLYRLGKLGIKILKSM